MSMSCCCRCNESSILTSWGSQIYHQGTSPLGTLRELLPPGRSFLGGPGNASHAKVRHSLLLIILPVGAPAALSDSPQGYMPGPTRTCCSTQHLDGFSNTIAGI